MNSPLLCPNCRKPVGAGVTVCPNCGASMPLPPMAGTALPTSVPAPPAPRLLTGNAVGDFILGMLASILAVAVAGLGILVMPILYFVLRPTLPVFARGIGYTMLLVGVLLLGAFGYCMYALTYQGH
ncbi:MAG: zinc ribbon domain-containing protein [Armatimonadota bacterium]|nr:zinc ribbon domain-containing protein [Armatimonadota bacterium]